MGPNSTIVRISVSGNFSRESASSAKNYSVILARALSRFQLGYGTRAQQATGRATEQSSTLKSPEEWTSRPRAPAFRHPLHDNSPGLLAVAPLASAAAETPDLGPNEDDGFFDQSPAYD